MRGIKSKSNLINFEKSEGNDLLIRIKSGIFSGLLDTPPIIFPSLYRSNFN